MTKTNRASGYVLVLVLLAAWEISARTAVLPSTSWPRLSSTLVQAVVGTISGELLSPWLSTLGRMFAGYAIGSLLGVLAGLIAGYSSAVRRTFNPLVETIRPIPTPAVIPPLILLLGIDDGLKIFVISLAVFFPLYINTVGGVDSVPAALIQTGRTFRTGKVRTTFGILLPAALPSVISGLRIAIGLALVVTVVAEMTAGSAGLGYYLLQMQFAMRPEAMYAAVLYLSLTGYVLNMLLQKIQSHVLRTWGLEAST